MHEAKNITESDLATLDVDDFWTHATRGDKRACWPWAGAVSDHGYGRYFRSGVEYRAHRVAFSLGKNTGLPGIVMVCHRCDNPLCVNPDHLFIGTALDNNRDAREKGRALTPTATRNGNGKLSDEQVEQIRVSPVAGATVARQFGVSPALVSMIRRGHRRQVVGDAGVEPATFRV